MQGFYGHQEPKREFIQLDTWPWDLLFSLKKKKRIIRFAASLKYGNMTVILSWGYFPFSSYLDLS